MGEVHSVCGELLVGGACRPDCSPARNLNGDGNTCHNFHNLCGDGKINYNLYSLS